MATIPGLGSEMSIGVLSTAASTPIGNVTAISGPGNEVSTRDITHLGSTAKEYARAIFDGGEATCTILLSTAATGYANIKSALTGATTPFTDALSVSGFFFKLALGSTAGPAITFMGLPVGFPITGIEPEGTVTAELTVKVTGAVTLP